MVFVGASAPVVLGESAKSAPTLADGEVKIYAKGGASVHLKANGDVLVKPGSAGKVELGGEGLPRSAGVVTGDCVCAFTDQPAPPSQLRAATQPTAGVLAKKEG